MKTGPAPLPARARPHRAAAWCGGVAMAVGVTAFAFRAGGSSSFALEVPGWPATHPLATPGIVMAGLALLLLGTAHRAAVYVAAVAALAALAASSPHGAIALCAASAAVAAAHVGGDRARRPVRFVALGVLGAAGVALCGMVLDIGALYGSGSAHRMSELTALALLALGSGLLAWTTARNDPDGILPLTPIVVTVALTAAVVATFASAQHADRAADAELAARTAVAATELDALTSEAIARLDDLAVGVATARDPEHGAFDALAGRILPESPFAAIAYLRRVSDPDAFRARRGVAIRDADLDGRVRPAADRAMHYPAVRAIGPHQGVFATGVDLLGRNPWTEQVLQQADATRLTRATQPLPMPEPIGRSTLLVSPSGGAGYIVGVLPLATVVARMDERLGTPGVAVRDGEGARGPRGWHRQRVDVAGRPWTLFVQRPSPATGRTVAIALITLLFTLVMGLASRLGSRRERRAEERRRAAEERSRRLAETSTDMLTVIDAEGRFAYLSPACRELLGVEPAALLGRRPLELIHPDDLDGVRSVFDAAAEGADRLTVTLRLRQAGGTWIWVESTLRVLRGSDGGLREAHATVRDISDRMAARKAIEEAEARFRSTFEEAPIGMAITAIDGHFQRVNRSLARLLGYSIAQLEGRHVSELTHPDDRSADKQAMQSMLAGATDSYRVEKRYLHAAGDVVWAALSTTLVRDEDGTPLYFLSQMQDVTERRRQEAELRHLADHDPLTGLLNRRSFERELERQVALVERYGPRGAALVLDLDNFKAINDTLGHGAGDDLIVRVAKALRERLRESDVLARLGGDEFAVLLPEGGRDEAVEVARGVLEAVREQAVPGASGRMRQASASIGIALFTAGPGLSGDAVLVEADLAMYEAKEAGRDRYAVADGGTPTSWTDLIREAFAANRFVLRAQPVVELPTAAVVRHRLVPHLEAPDGELIAPVRFLPLAERFDIAGELDRWTVAHAIATLAQRDTAVELRLSSRSTADEELLALIAEELAATGADPARVVFELAETDAAAQRFAARLAELGCGLAGSFRQLRHLPLDHLVLDAELLEGCADSRTDQLVIRAVVDIARGLGKRTVAEPAGDDATLALLRELGVDEAQRAEWLDTLPGQCGPSRSASAAPL